MNIHTAVKRVADQFRYSADKKIIIGDFWSIMKPRNGYLYGDCDDFAVTCIWECCDRNIWKFLLNVFLLHKYRLYFARTVDGSAHIVGYAQGLWFDNWTKAALDKEQFVNQTGHKIKMFYPSPWIAKFMILGLFHKNKEL